MKRKTTWYLVREEGNKNQTLAAVLVYENLERAREELREAGFGATVSSVTVDVSDGTDPVVDWSSEQEIPTTVCSATLINPRFLSKEERFAGKAICEGPMHEAKRCFANGGSDHRCEKHAVYLAKANPSGPVYKRVK